jgi:hypothetical protein
MQLVTNNLSIKSVIPMIDNEHDFRFLRCHLLNKPTITEYQIGSRIATTIDTIHDNTVDDALPQTRPR